MTGLLLLAATASGIATPWPLLLLAAVALAVRAAEGAWARRSRVNGLLTDVNLVPEQVVATIQLRRGRLVLVRRRA